MKTIIVATCILGLAGSRVEAAPVIIEGHQAPAQEFLTEQVSFADLNILSDAGLSTLKTRINAAATRVCESVNPEPLMAKMESNVCYRRAISDSYAQIDRVLASRNNGAAVAAATVTVSAQ